MLSICIPVYNTEIRSLVRSLHQQCVDCKIAFEIICIDDVSSNTYKELNHSITSLPEIKYSELTKNVGRAVIRNLLAEQAQYEYILFVDSDVSIPQSDFIKKYLDYMQQGKSVVVGGISYPEKLISKNNLLHFTYGIRRESKPAYLRAKNPYSSFLTGNLLIQRAIVQEIQFLYSLKEYGHEDTLFCLELKKRSIPIQHIDNVVVHEGLETNEVFVSKQLTAVKNLATLICEGYNMKGVFLYDVYLILKKYRLIGLYIFFFTILKPIVHKRLTSGRSQWLFLFDALRLYELSSALKKN